MSASHVFQIFRENLDYRFRIIGHHFSGPSSRATASSGSQLGEDSGSPLGYRDRRMLSLIFGKAYAVIGGITLRIGTSSDSRSSQATL